MSKSAFVFIFPGLVAAALIACGDTPTASDPQDTLGADAGADTGTSTTDAGPKATCATAGCSADATCSDASGAPVCTCKAGFSGNGKTCTEINDCAGNPCQNGGACADGASKYTCTCAAGFSGTNCETNIDDCASNPCQNGGTCVDGANKYTCNCANGFSGTTCAVLPASCLAIKTANAAAASGSFMIDPDGAGPIAAFSTYCDMATAGGGWTLTARWAGVGLNEWSHEQVCGATGNVRTQTNDAATRPVPPDDTLAAWGTTCMVKPGDPTFIATYGDYFTYAAGTLDGPSFGVDVTYAIGGVIPSSSAWGLWGDASLTNFSVIPAVVNNGLCGGPNVCASMACPSSRAWNACHWDQVNVQEVYRR